MEQKRLRLEGKVAIVTGAGSRGPDVSTGQATSTMFAREGAKVLLVDRVARHAEETLATILAEGGEVSVLEADVTSAENCRAAVDAAVERYGSLNILFNNVGIIGPGSVVDVKEEDWDRVLEVNLKSMMLTSKYAVPRMVEAGGGSIVNVSSISGLRGGGGQQGHQHTLCGLQGRRHRHDHRHGGGPRQGQYPGQLHRARPHLHTHGVRRNVG